MRHGIFGRICHNYLVVLTEPLFDKVDTRRVALLIVINSLQLVLSIVVRYEKKGQKTPWRRE